MFTDLISLCIFIKIGILGHLENDQHSFKSCLSIKHSFFRVFRRVGWDEKLNVFNLQFYLDDTCRVLIE